MGINRFSLDWILASRLSLDQTLLLKGVFFNPSPEFVDSILFCHSFPLSIINDHGNVKLFQRTSWIPAIELRTYFVQ